MAEAYQINFKPFCCSFNLVKVVESSSFKECISFFKSLFSSSRLDILLSETFSL